ncbi:porin [Burkholderia sp. TSV86]|uniref:porin n=1 Tax=Burkholderia sp. TSV86 TaxID=1385594 RepID=UPI00075F4432|nr:porin [Burkholderia sp. TSV86]KVE32429.1 porin [Burkholderia sp. TSV86]
MKKLTLSTLSLALLSAAGAAHAQSSVTLYGVIDTSITYVHGVDGQAKNLWAMGSGNLQGSRWGLKGVEDIGGGLKAIFQLENGFDSATGHLNQGGRIFGRQAFVGLQSNQLGTLTLGRQYDPLVDLVQPITADNYFGSLFATPGDVDNNDNSLRVNNAVKYTSPVYAGLQFEAMYSFGGIAGRAGSGLTYSVAAAYNNGPFSIAGGYFNANNLLTANRPNNAWTAPSADALFDSHINDAYMSARSVAIAQVAAQYVYGPFTFGAGYANSEFDRDGYSVAGFHKSQYYDTGRGFVIYQATPALMLGLGYIFTKSRGDADAKYHQVSVGADYSLSKRTDVYLAGAYQHASGTQLINAGGTLVSQPAQASIGSYGYNGTKNQEMVAVGLRHKF